MPNWGFVWMVAWPDFRMRLRRFLVIGFGMALVLAVTLLLSAFSEGFNLRAERLVAVFDADLFLVAEGAAGPFTTSTPFDASVAEQVRAGPGVEQVDPLLFVPTSVAVDGGPVGMVVAAAPADAAWPRVIEGRAIAGPGEAIADVEIDALEIGSTIVLGGADVTIVGRTEHSTWSVATAGLYIDRSQALTLFAGGADVATAMAVSGAISAVPDGLEVTAPDAAVADLVSRTDAAKRSIDSFRVTLWVLAVVIVGAVLYLAALERVRDFAIFKATGSSNLDLMVGLALQAALVGAVAGVASIGLAHLMKPIYPGLLSLPLSIAWPAVPVAMTIAVVSSVVGIRRAIAVDPGQAFG